MKTKPWIRVIIAIAGTLIIFGLSKILTSKVIPEEPEDILIFQNALLLIVLGSSIIEFKYTGPSEALVNGLFGLISLFTVYKVSNSIAWWALFIFCVIVGLSAAICLILIQSIGNKEIYRKINHITYRISSLFGSARVLFSIIFLYGLISFYTINDPTFLVLTLFWGIYIVIWPLKIPELLSYLFRNSHTGIPIGEGVSIDSPNLLRAVIKPGEKWSSNNVKVFVTPERELKYVIPLYFQHKEGQVLGTGIITSTADEEIRKKERGKIYDSEKFKSATKEDIIKLLKGNEHSKLLGFIIEESRIKTIRIEVIDPSICIAGALVWCWVDNKQIYFQVNEGLTWEETLESERHGFQIAEAIQLGLLDKESGFKKYDWLPSMNTPVFIESKDFGEALLLEKEGDFTFGFVPGTRLKVLGEFHNTIEYHTAILGVTGSGKTELAFDLIRDVIKHNTKVICIDLTNKYSEKLQNLGPEMLAIGEETMNDLSEKIFEADTGAYGGGTEKKVLKEFSQRLVKEIEGILIGFISSETSKLGIISLQEISNTKATLYITEIYMSLLFNMAKTNKDFTKVLVVVEEAHTVMPETNSLGLGDFDSKALVGKISQIALQGRKYGIGLLVISQRTATVSKSVLTQCNTVISFACYDDTSLNFLRNVYGSDYVNMIPNLKFLQAIAYGKGIKSERPIYLEIPYSKDKE